MRARAFACFLASTAALACSDAATPLPSESSGGVAGASGGASTAIQAGASGSFGAAGTTGTATGGATSGGESSGAGGAAQAGAAGYAGIAGQASGGQANDLRSLAQELDGFRWEIACGAAVGEWSCADLATGVESCPASGTQFANKTITLGGTPGKVYSLELRFRGVMEPNVYTDGAPDCDGFLVGGSGGGHRDIVAIHVSEPEQVYYLNSVPSTEGPHYALEVDYVKKIEVSGGATIKLTGDDLDCITDKNCKKGSATCEPVAVADVPPFPAAWNGNFIQMDVVAVSSFP